MHTLALFISRHWKTLVVGGGIWLVILGIFGNRTRGLAESNHELSAQIANLGVSESSERLARARQENDRLKSELQAIVELKTTVGSLSNEVVAEQAKSIEVWAARSNYFQTAIDHERKEINDLHQWEKDWTRTQERVAAEARIAEKIASAGYDPVNERENAGKILRQIALTTQKRLELIESRMKSGDKSEEARDTHRAKLQEINAAWQEAIQQLGADQPLYENLPVKPADYDAPKTPLMRSVIPDREGLAVTVYLDGSVEWSRPQ